MVPSIFFGVHRVLETQPTARESLLRQVTVLSGGVAQIIFEPSILHACKF